MLKAAALIRRVGDGLIRSLSVPIVMRNSWQEAP